MKAIIVGGGIGGLATALMLHARGIDCEVYEQADAIRELGVGINTLPHAIDELADLGLLERLDAVAIRTYELFYLNRFGQEIWREPRGTRRRLRGAAVLDPSRPAAGRDLARRSRARLGETRIHTGCRLGALHARTRAASPPISSTAHGSHRRDRPRRRADRRRRHPLDRARDALSRTKARRAGTALMLWRGAIDWPAFLTGRSMIVAGGMAAKLVVYPIAEGSRARPQADQLGGGGAASATGGAAAAARRTGRAPAGCEELMPHVAALRDPVCRRRGADRGDAASSGNIRCATAIRCRAGRTAA